MRATKKAAKKKATKVTKTRKKVARANSVNNTEEVNTRISITMKQAHTLATKLVNANVKVPAFLAKKLV